MPPMFTPQPRSIFEEECAIDPGLSTSGRSEKCLLNPHRGDLSLVAVAGSGKGPATIGSLCRSTRCTAKWHSFRALFGQASPRRDSQGTLISSPSKYGEWEVWRMGAKERIRSQVTFTSRSLLVVRGQLRGNSREGRLGWPLRKATSKFTHLQPLSGREVRDD